MVHAGNFMLIGQFVKYFNYTSGHFGSIKGGISFLVSKMTTPDALQRFESRAATAEQLISSLRVEIDEVKKLTSDQHNKENVERLQSENVALKAEIEKWKNRLIQLELQSGVKQVPLPSSTSAPKAAAPQPTAVSSAASVADNSHVEEKKKKKEKPVAAEKKAKGDGGSAAADEPPVDVGRLDLRVGRIVTAKKHPDADSLYVEEVDLGEEKPRTVVSGLVKFVPLDAMQGRLAVLLCNLKPSKMRGVTSEAMVMCASTPDKVEILIPPSGSQPGDLVHVDGFPRVPDPVLNPKKKVFETVAPDLKTDGQKVATYKGVAWSVAGKGVVTAASLVGVAIK